MIRVLLTGIPVMVMCLVLQAVFITFCLRRYVHHAQMARNHHSFVRDIILLAMVMLIMLLGNFIQTGIWAALFMLLGEFNDFTTALYFSGVNFATLGYGDIVLSERWRLLGPLEASHGILMFGVSTAVMTAAVFDVLKASRARRDSSS